MRATSALLVLLLACSAADDRAPDSAGATPHGRPQPANPRASTGTAARVAPAPGPGDSTCEQAHAIVQRALNVTVLRDTARSFAAPTDDSRWTGCRYTAALTLRVDDGDIPEYRLRRAFDGAGWAVVNDYDAGGADGSAFAYRRGDTLCHVADQQLVDVPDPGSPADTARREPVPHALEIRCTAPVPERS